MRGEFGEQFCCAVSREIFCHWRTPSSDGSQFRLNVGQSTLLTLACALAERSRRQVPERSRRQVFSEFPKTESQLIQHPMLEAPFKVCTMFEVNRQIIHVMKNLLLLPLAFVVALASCTQSKYATTGPYESDDAYYATSDTYITDFALVDDEAQMSSTRDSSAGTSDDYYDPNYAAPQVYSPNSYNNASTYSPNPWGCNSGYGYSGFGNYGYGSYMNSYGPMMGIGWSPYSGYYTNFGYGFGSGMNPYCNNYYSPYNSWYTPYYGPSYYNSWSYNSWYSPYNYYSSGFPYYGNNGNDATTIVHGPRNPIATASGNNSSYSGNLFYSGIKKGERHNYVQTLNKPNPAEPAATPHHEAPVKPQSQLNTKPSKPGVTVPATQRPSYKPAKPPREVNRNVKPGFTPSNAPSRNYQPTESRPQQPRTDRPSPAQTQPSHNAPPRQEQRAPRPHYEAPKAPSRDYSPPRNSSPSVSPSRSSGGGGSTNSPRHK